MQRYRMERVAPSRVEAVHALLVACGAEMTRRGFMNWSVPYPLDRLRADAVGREVYLVHQAGEAGPVATFTIGVTPSRVYDDDAIWEEPGSPALYLNRLAVSPSAQGGGLGSWCMREIEAMALLRGCRAVRFDVLAANAGLRGFYERLGYRARGEREHDGWRFACYERRLFAGAGGDEK
jgi:ribosomal protein S18 acetylase RimI-like enzyme